MLSSLEIFNCNTNKSLNAASEVIKVGSIRQPYLNQVFAFATTMGASFPLDIEITDTQGHILTTGKFHIDGTITVNANPTRGIVANSYSSPSAMRQDIIAKNTRTYSYIRYKGRTFRDWGVVG